MGAQMRNLWVHMTGPDRPGILGRLLEGVADLGLELTDVEQVAVGDRLILALAVVVPERVADAHAGLTDLGKELGLVAELRDERRTSDLGSQVLLVVHVLGEPVPARALAAIGYTLAAHGANIRRAETLARRRLHCVELEVACPATEEPGLTRALLAVAAGADFDVAVQAEGMKRRAKRLLIMDVDSTLIQAEVIDELAAAAGVGDQVAKVTERAMNGELDFSQALAERVALLKGLPVSVLDEVHARIRYTPGARSMVKVLREMGYRIGILSGGFTQLTDRFRDELELDYAYANTLEIEDGRLTGRTVGPIVDGARKAALLGEIAGREGVRLDQVIAVGDGANDLPMMARAGLGVAFNAKPRVREQAPTSINRKGLDAILFLLGVREEEIERVERGLG
jgi:phosphoserine phosphatase